MKALLAILLLSVLLASGSSLECETCVGQGNTCSGNKVACPSAQDACINVVTENTVGPTTITMAMKSCSVMSACKQFKTGSTGKIGTLEGRFVRVECSKAPATPGSFLLALSSLLLLKLFV